MSIEALIFDVDGTLADNEKSHLAAFNRAFQQFELGWEWKPAEYRELLKVTGGKERIRHFIEHLDVSDDERQSLRAMVTELHAEQNRQYGMLVAAGNVPLRDGIERLLREAHAAGCKLAIASATSSANIEALLRAALGPRGMEMFHTIACGDQVRVKKPAPDIYRAALSGLGTRPERAVAFEDSPNGLLAANAAGLRTVVTPTWWTEGGDFSGAAILLPGLGDPGRPLQGEPGGQLRSTAWLTLDELSYCTSDLAS